MHNRSTTIALALAFAAAAPACAPVIPVMPPPPANPTGAGMDAVDDAEMQRLDVTRVRLRATPGAVTEARVFAREVTNALQLGTVDRRRLDREALLGEAGAALDQAVAEHPGEAAEAMFAKGGMLVAAGKDDAGIAALRASMDARPSPRACTLLVSELDKRGDPGHEIVPLCKRARPNSNANDETRYALLDACLQHAHAPSVEAGLAWAGADDIAFYKSYGDKLEAERQASRAEDNRQREALYAELGKAHAEMQAENAARDTSGGARAGGGGGTFSLTLHNNCPRTVKLFFGQKPKFGSGTSSSLGANNVTSYSGNAGDMIWIIDDSENGLSSISPSGHQDMQITSSCTGFAPY